MIRNILVVGCGVMGRTWLKAITENPRVKLAGVVDVRLEAAQSAAKDFGLAPGQAFTDLRQAITAVRPDFICDITIPEAHCPSTVTALKMGVPVLGEKPLAASMAQARTMLKAADQTKILYAVSQSRRYNPNHRTIADLVRTGAIGRPTTINCDFYIGAHFGGFRDTMESPLILDMAIHHFDLCRMITAADPVAVYAHEFNPAGSWYQGKVAASVIFEMSDGLVFTYRGSWCAEGCHTSWNGDWRVIGDRGTLLMAGDKAPLGRRVKAGGKPGFHAELEDIPVTVAPLKDNEIRGALQEFLDAFDGGPKPQGEVHDNIKSLAMVFAAIASARAGRRIPVKC